MNNQGFSKICVVFILIALIAAGTLSYQYFGKQSREENINETIYWSTYQNDVSGYSFKYPGDQFEVAEIKTPEEKTVTYLKAAPPDDIPGIEILVNSLDEAEHIKRTFVLSYGKARRDLYAPAVDCETARKNVAIDDVLIGGDIQAIKMYNKNGVIDRGLPNQYTFFFTKENKTFTITFIQPEDYPVDYLPIFNQILSTFKVL